MSLDASPRSPEGRRDLGDPVPRGLFPADTSPRPPDPPSPAGRGGLPEPSGPPLARGDRRGDRSSLEATATSESDPSQIRINLLPGAVTAAVAESPRFLQPLGALPASRPCIPSPHHVPSPITPPCRVPAPRLFIAIPTLHPHVTSPALQLLGVSPGGTDSVAREGRPSAREVRADSDVPTRTCRLGHANSDVPTRTRGGPVWPV